jgi:tetratricopeptide (TPR) repeat protein
MSHLNSATIKAYLDDSLDSEMLRATEQHLLICPLCADAVEGFALYENAQTVQSAAETVSQPVKPIYTIPPFPSASAKWKLAIAAMFLLPIGAGYLLSRSNMADVFATHYSTMPSDAPTMRSGSASMLNAAKTSMDSAMEFFSDVNYEQSFTRLKAISDADKTNLKAALYAGCSAMELKNWAEAERLLERVHLAEANEYANHALWYLTLTELQLGKKERAKDFLRELIDQESDWKSNAQQLLKDLK